jgi:predicted amidohydrolase YtcJ
MAQTKKAADIIVFDAVVYTVDNNFSKASAFVIKDGKFIAVGDNLKILKEYKADKTIDAEGKAIYPGFNDGHSHFLGYGIVTTQYANLVGTSSFEQVVYRLKKFNKQNNPEWLLGRGWDQNDWDITEFPVNNLLNKNFPDKPVVLTRIDGHAVLANDAALKTAGITARTKIDGGEIILYNGKPTGVLIDNAADLMKSFVPDFDKAQKTEALKKAQEDCFAVGLTTVTDAGLDKDDILLIDSLQQRGIIKMRVYAMINPTQENFEYFYTQNPWHKE